MTDPLEGACHDRLHPAHGFDKDDVLIESTSRDLNIGETGENISMTCLTSFFDSSL